MSGDPTHVSPGDIVTLTITGTIADPAKAGTPDAAELTLSRSPRLLFGTTGVPHSGAIRINAVFQRDVDVKYEVTSRWKNGVWIDGNGRYWMRRPDGWHEMSIKDEPVRLTLGVFAPPDPRRLREDKA